MHSNPVSSVETSKFYMIRCVVAMAHADGVVVQEEIDHIEKFIARIPFSEEQVTTLREDLKTQQSVSVLLSHINDPSYRSQVVHFARILAYKDGELHPDEEALLNHMHLTVIDSLDMEQIKADVHNYVEGEMIHHELRMDAQRPNSWLAFGWMDWALVHLGIDLMDE